MQRKDIRPSITSDGHNTNPWSYFDHQNLALYLNPGLASGQLLHITSTGVQRLPQMPKNIKPRLDPPKAVAPIGFRPVDTSGLPATPQDLQHNVFSWMTPAHYDCRTVIAWIFSAPLGEWLTDTIHLRFVGSNADTRKRVLGTLSCLQYGHATAIGTTTNIAVDQARTNPIVLSTARPELDSLNTVASNGALLASTGTDQMFTGEMQRRTAYVVCNPTFREDLIPLTAGSLARWRTTMLAVQVQILSRLLKRFETERAAMPAQTTPAPYYTFQHGPIIQAIADEMDAM